MYVMPIQVFKCELIQNDFTLKLIFIEAEDIDKAMTKLNKHRWPDGVWRITPAEWVNEWHDEYH